MLWVICLFITILMWEITPEEVPQIKCLTDVSMFENMT